MNIDKAKQLKEGDEVYHNSSFYDVANTSIIWDQLMIGVYTDSEHKRVHYIDPNEVYEVIPCYDCQGGGCPTCQGYGKFIQ